MKGKEEAHLPVWCRSRHKDSLRRIFFQLAAKGGEFNRFDQSSREVPVPEYSGDRKCIIEECVQVSRRASARSARPGPSSVARLERGYDRVRFDSRTRFSHPLTASSPDLSITEIRECHFVERGTPTIFTTAQKVSECDLRDHPGMRPRQRVGCPTTFP